jgi:flagellar operon protein
MVDAVKRLPPLPGITGPERIPEIQPSARPRSPGTKEFQDVLARELEPGKPLTFSAHAQSRLLSRQIHLTDPQVQRLQQGVQNAAEKGARESLIVMDSLAFIVSVSNRTVITAVEGAAQNGNVFTQIDSAVIV